MKRTASFRKFHVLKSDPNTNLTAKNKYIMMAHIMRGAMHEDGFIIKLIVKNIAMQLKQHLNLHSQLNQMLVYVQI